MANQKATPNAIQLTSLLNMQRDKSDIVPYNRFNSNNAPFYGGTLSPFWAQEGDAGNSATFDKDGNKWTFVSPGSLYKNDEKIKEFNPYGFKQVIFSGNNVYFYTEYIEGDIVHKVKCYASGDWGFNVSIDGELAFYEDSQPIYVSAKYVSGYLVVASVTSQHFNVYIFRYGQYVNATVFFGGYGLPVIAVTQSMPDFIFFQSLPGVGPLNKELDDYFSNIYCWQISTDTFYTTKIKNPNNLDVFKKPILLDTGNMFHGRASQFVEVGGVTSVIQEYYFDDANPTISGSTIEISATFVEVYSVSFTAPSAYNNTVLQKAGTILSPYWYRQTIEFNDTSQHNPYNAVFDASVIGYMLHTGYTSQNDSFFCMVPKLYQYMQLKNMLGKQGYWSIAYNNGYISGIGYSDKSYGALLTDWLDIDNECLITFTDEFFIYRNNAGDFVKVSVTDLPDWRIKIIDNKIIVNTVDEVNALNLSIAGDQSFTWASVYNGDLLLDKYYTALNINVVSGTPYYPVELVAAAINPNYEQDPLRVPSAIFAPVVCEYATLLGARIPMTVYDLQDYVEVYLSKDNGALKFWGIASKNGLKTMVKFLDMTYPIDSSGNPLLSPSLFAELIQSGVKKDMLINGGSAYPLQYYDNTIPIYLYYLLSGVTSLKNVFILQGTVYGVTDENILFLSYSDSVVSGIDVIAIKANMRYLGATPYTAYFWSEQNKSIYEFQGDRLLRKLYEANEINEIYTTSYNSATYTLFIATDKGVYCVGDSMYRIEINTVSKIEQTDTDTILFYTDENSAEKCCLIRYDSAPGYERQKLHLCTSFYGAGVNVVSVLDTWYIHFYNNGLAEDGEIKLRLETLTNTGRKTETKTVKVKASDWDELTNTYYLRYQPQYQRSIGASLDIVSDFAIRDFAVTSQADTLQVGGSV